MTTLDYRKATFHLSASRLSECPPDQGREVAFTGRSNAGKSSAINTLSGQQSLARTSKTPGRTQLLNFFSLAPDTYLVDLPGFGYAKVSKTLKQQWQKQLEHYLQERQSLQGLVLLMDIRHPFHDFDRLILNWAVKAGMPVHLLLTKADKLRRGAASNALLQAKREIKTLGNEVTVQLFSSLKHQGVDELHTKLNSWLLDAETDDEQTDITEEVTEETKEDGP